MKGKTNYRLEEEKAKDLVNGILDEFTMSPETLAEAFQFASKFYTYSPKNTKLIFSQNRGATYCQSFKGWKDMGASVKAGEHGLKIWVPVQVTVLDLGDRKVQLSNATKEQKEQYKQGKIRGRKTLHFKLGTVFDISQTTFPKERYPELYSVGFTSDEHNKICEAIKLYSLEKLKCPIIETDMQSISIRGTYTPSQNIIRINNNLEDTQRLCTMLHELGHQLTYQKEIEKSVPYKEMEADAMSIMLQSTYNLELSDTRKNHFVSSFHQFINNLEGRNPYEEVDKMFDYVYDTYQNNIDEINKYVVKEIDITRQISQNKEVTKEKKLEREREKDNEIEI